MKACPRKWIKIALISTALLSLSAWGECPQDSVNPVDPSVARLHAQAMASITHLILPASSEPVSAEEINQCANDAVDGLLKNFWNPERQEFLLAPNHSPPCLDQKKQEHSADYWLSAQALDSVIDAYGRTHRKDLLNVIEQFFTKKNQSGWLEKVPHKFYDDEGWMALALVHASEVTGNPHYLDAARTIYNDIKKGWDETCCGKNSGGIWFSSDHKQKATIANATTALLAAKIGLHDNNKKEIAFAKKVYDYWRKESVKEGPFNNPNFLQSEDHVKGDGTHVGGRLSYNEGMMAGASLEIFKATADPKYLSDAKKFSNYILDQETEKTPFGPVLSDREVVGQSCKIPHDKDTPLYKYNTLRSMHTLYNLLPPGAEKKSLRSFLAGNGAAICRIARDHQTGRFSANWEKKDSGSQLGSLISPSIAATGAINIFAQIQ